jgi:hypothetical protein
MTQGPIHDTSAQPQGGSDDLTLWVDRLRLQLDKWGEPYEVIQGADGSIIIGVETRCGFGEMPVGLSIVIATTE